VSGATFVAVTRPGAAPLLRAIEAYDATLAVVAPAMLEALAGAAAGPPRHRPLRLLVAGPPPDEDVVRACGRHDWSVGTLR
jgi:acyl-coenzyme A synthetase/AMP-(fatty) acid ligase